MVKEGREGQTECHTQKGVRDTQDHSALDSVYPGPQHQGAQAVHCRLVPVIRAEAQAQSAQWPQQRTQGFRHNQIQDKKDTGTRHSPGDSLPETGEGIAGIRVFRQQGGTGKAHPHKPLHAKDLPGRQDQADTQRHAQLPQADWLRQIKPPHHMMKPDLTVLMPVLGKQDCTAEQIANQRQEAAANQSLAGDGIARKIDVCKAVQAAVSHLRPLGGHIEKGKEADKVERNQENRRNHCRRTGRQYQNGQCGRPESGGSPRCSTQN